MKLDEEQDFRKKVTEMAGEEVRRYAKVPILSVPSAHKAGAKVAAKKLAQPVFSGDQLRVFDISLSNEPILIYSATARLPEAGETPKDYFVTVVARQDINGDMHKLLAVVTDADHLDVNPRMQLIDAVDADGDGRAELLFRQISDAGSAYAIYRVHPDQLYPLFEGTPE